MAKHELQQTRGEFKIRGIVSGTEKETFYSEKPTKKGIPARRVNFGVEVDKGQTIYVSLYGMVEKEVTFSKRGEKGAKNINKKVPWSEKDTWTEEGFQLIGKHIGLTKVIDKDGKEKNENEVKILVKYDANKVIAEKLKDGMSVTITGDIEYQTYNGKTTTNFTLGKIYLATSDIDFEDEKFEKMAKFKQTICFNGVEKVSDNDFTINAISIGYSDIVDFEMKCSNPKLAKNLKGLKPYTSIKLTGDLMKDGVVETVEEDDGWGTNSYDRVQGSFETVLMIESGDRDSIDETLYTEDSVDIARAALNTTQTATANYELSDGIDVDLSGGDDSGEDW